ncbi:MAG: ECF transporter S component [Bacteroidaceae bacterium]|nr:ECF transporter S component [Bacteroidaceae bacterium]
MTSTLKLYTLNYTELKTYLWAALFVVCNMALPQLFHLIPQGGIIFAPLSLVILAGAYKFGWKVGLLAAIASPIVNHFVFGMPAWGVLQVMVVKLAILALVAGFAAQYFRKANLLMLTGVVLVSELLGGLGELLLTGGIAATLADFTLGWPGLLLQVLGTYALLHYIDRH